MSHDVQIEGKYDAFIKEMLDRLCPYYWNGDCKMRLKCGMHARGNRKCYKQPSL
jgi:hypothetical protein